MSTLKAKRAAALAEPIPDQPNAAFLLRVLRDHEFRAALLPDFEWHYADCSCCAMGLAFQLWPRQLSGMFNGTTLYAAERMGAALGLGIYHAFDVFIDGADQHGEPEPEDIADALEQAMAEQTKGTAA